MGDPREGLEASTGATISTKRRYKLCPRPFPAHVGVMGVTTPVTPCVPILPRARGRDDIKAVAVCRMATFPRARGHDLAPAMWHLSTLDLSTRTWA